MNRRLFSILFTIIFLLSLPLFYLGWQLLEFNQKYQSETRKEIIGSAFLRHALSYQSSFLTSDQQAKMVDPDEINKTLSHLAPFSSEETVIIQYFHTEHASVQQLLASKSPYSEKNQSLRRYIRKLITQSSLILDPEKGTYFLISAISIYLPSYLEEKQLIATPSSTPASLTLALNYREKMMADLNFSRTFLKEQNLLSRETINKLSSQIDSFETLDIKYKDTENIDNLLQDAFYALDEALVLRLRLSQKHTNTSLFMSLLFWIASVLLTYFIYFRILNVRKELQLIIENQKQTVLAAQKLATLGELSASIGHEIMNPISVIRSTASLMEKNSADNKIVAHAQRILKMTDRTQQIIKSMKTFAHRQEGVPGSPQNLHEGLAETLLLLNDKIRNQNITIVNEIPESLPPALSTESELAQILMNIIGNAIDALKDSADKQIHLSARKEKEFIVLSIKDNGPGIPPDIQNKIFDSLFTTKAVGHGTGLGLAISKQIMERHGGFIKLQTEVEKGAQFDLYFKIAGE